MKNQENELGNLIAKTREEKGLSQRQLAKIANMDNTELSRIEKGLRQKVNVLFLRGIAEGLDLSLVKLMELAGYSEFDINWGRNRELNRSTQDILEELDKTEKKYLNLRQETQDRVSIVRKERAKLADLLDKYRNLEYSTNKKKFDVDYVMKVVEEVFEGLKEARDKYKD